MGMDMSREDQAGTTEAWWRGPLSCAHGWCSLAAVRWHTEPLLGLQCQPFHFWDFYPKERTNRMDQVLSQFC